MVLGCWDASVPEFRSGTNQLNTDSLLVVKYQSNLILQQTFILHKNIVNNAIFA